MTFAVKQSKKRKTYDLYVENRKFLNFESKKDAEKFVEERSKLPVGQSFHLDKNDVQIKEKKSNPYVIGEMWRDDFDYEGMVKIGSEADTSWGVKKLNKLFDSYEDVNYHLESNYLYSAIKNLEDGKEEQAEKDLIRFRKVNKSLLRKWKK